MQNKLMKAMHLLLFLALAVGLASPVSAVESHGHGAAMDHSAMGGGGKLVMLEEVTVNGVRATAHIEDVGKAMAAAGMKETHHLMLTFTDEQSEKTISEGLVAIKVSDPHGKTGAALKTIAMEGSFGADLALTMPGTYKFEAGTKLADGQKRQFSFTYTLK